GAFHQPQLVLADIDLLSTLPRREFVAGYAEVMKYGLLGDRAFFDWLEVNSAALIGGDVAARTNAVAVSCRTKARIVAEDEREGGVRALLNLGHTFGHALEAEARYDSRLVHGEAVGIGMVMAFELSARLGFCPPADAARVRAHLASCGLPTTAASVGLGSVTTEALIEHMKQDKKVVRGKLTFVLARAIGDAFLTQDVDIADVRDLLVRELAA
ncbi:MAG: 3-dehydroquinate synthase, partial [Minwuiales bacterium]|nr:3-dehydroquinate synthase [Minwuiales bacterium]